ncbi:hypothetical protein Syun_025038 [Stephania yunnanensis]|uniref:Uncharacterized protein n=1 Tax=Stephania yunnanensis TaxID=152371 RepID=A0AAP0HQV9_9MAGN
MMSAQWTDRAKDIISTRYIQRSLQYLVKCLFCRVSQSYMPDPSWCLHGCPKVLLVCLEDFIDGRSEADEENL